jgi:uncharacterized repeat protein (TIGR02543 family)
MAAILPVYLSFAILALFSYTSTPATADSDDWSGPISVEGKTLSTTTARQAQEKASVSMNASQILNDQLRAEIPTILAIKDTASRMQKKAPDSGPLLQIGSPVDIPELSQDITSSAKMMLGHDLTADALIALRIASPGALGLRLGLHIDELPSEVVLAFYSGSSNEPVAEPVTGAEVWDLLALNQAAGDVSEEGRTYWSPMIAGDEAIVLVMMPPGVQADQIRFSIPTISHIEQDAFSWFSQSDGNTFASGSQALQTRLLNDSPTIASKIAERPTIASYFTTNAAAACNVDVTCAPDWNTAAAGVAKMIFTLEDGSTRGCTGALLNDKHSSGIPYFLSANHCISTQTVASALETYWFYQSPGCNLSGTDWRYQPLTGGAELLYANADTDVAFLQLRNTPPSGSRLLAWTTTTPGMNDGLVGIHHPKGDRKKISDGYLAGYWDCTPLSNANPDGDASCSSASSASGEYLKVNWVSGLTERGSSGSPIFNLDYQVVGQLYAGDPGTCSDDEKSYYGRFDFAFQAALSQWLYSDDIPEPATHAIQTSASPSSGGSVSCNPNPVDDGGDSLCTAAANSGYLFDHWSGHCSGTNPSCTLSNVTGDKSVTANFTQQVAVTHSIQTSASPSAGGSVSCNPNPVDDGEDSLCTATANSGYLFDHWSGHCSGTNPSCTLSNVTGAKSVTANFKQQVAATHTIQTSASPSAGGSVSCNPNPVEDGEDSICTATPSCGYRFESWSGDCSGTDETCTLNNVTAAAKSVSARFQEIPELPFRSLSVSLVGPGTVSSQPEDLVCDQDSCSAYWGYCDPVTTLTLTAIADEGASFVGWCVETDEEPGDGEDDDGSLCTGEEAACTGTQPSCTLTVDASARVTATFSTDQPVNHTIQTSASPSAGGSVSCNPNPIEDGEDSTCTASANSGYLFTNWSGDCSGTNPSCTLSNVTGDKSVTANFTQQATITHTIQTNVSPSAGGSVSCNPNPVEDGEDSTCTASANPGYQFTNWSGHCSGTNPSCTLSDVTGAKSVTANFEQQAAVTYTIQTSASPSAGGSVSCNPNPVEDGEDSTCTASANSGYSFTNWSDDCSGTNPSCTLSNVTGDKSVTANFTAQTVTHTIQTSVSPSAGGSVSCNPNPVGDSEDSLCTATANAGYAFESWSGDCSGTSPNCMLSNVTAAQAVTANFRATSASSIQLNDTGIDWCADGDTNNLDCPVAGYPGQDGVYGRDTLARAGLLEKVGAGAAGFDFTKLDANGQDLPATATDWTCVRDNVTGLIWEVKTTDGGLRDKDQTYTWDDSFTYASDVNTQALCGFNDWRVPTMALIIP